MGGAVFLRRDRLYKFEAVTLRLISWYVVLERLALARHSSLWMAQPPLHSGSNLF